ncbi:ester cyclase [Symbioplanes lichenis]|uniref:ester cyclase n=1 Tax=Symbioplanes lichenis TaxID=1629072 RepID=UPI002739465F|nr:ester cyclase [Actinoplanes lichenis]
MPDLTWDIQELLVDGDRAAVRLIDSGTPIASWLGLEPTGAAVSFAETAVYELRDGRLTAMTFLVDLAGLRHQLAGQKTVRWSNIS